MTHDRRTFLAHVAGVGAAWAIADRVALSEALAHAAQAVAQQPPPAFAVLTVDEAAQFAAIAERIMPTTDTPGAREAGVVYFADKAFGSFLKDDLASLRKGLADLRTRVGQHRRGATSFASLPAADQDAVLKASEKEEWFRLVRSVTMGGMFGDPSWGGNRNRVGWGVIDFRPAASHKPPFGYYDAEAAKGR